MYGSFKNFELLRHQVSFRIERALREYSLKNQNNTNNLASNIFAASLSFVASIAAQSYVNNGQIKAIWFFALFVLVYIIANVSYLVLAREISRKWYNRKKHKEKSSLLNIKEYIDDFDHIACDYNLIASGFRNKYIEDVDEKVATYDYYEAFYYSKISADKIECVLNHNKTCINTINTSDRIDLFRVFNQLDLLDESISFLESHCTDVEIMICENLRLAMIQQIISLKLKAQDCRKKCDSLKAELFSDAETNNLRKMHGNFLVKKTSKNKI